MRNEIQAQGSTLTVGELRAALEGVDDGAAVLLMSEVDVNDEYLSAYSVTSAVGTDLYVTLVADIPAEVYPDAEDV